MGGAALVKFFAICLRAAVCLTPNFVSGLVGVGLSRVWVRSAATCVSASYEYSLGNVSVAGEIRSVCDFLIFSSCGRRTLSSGNVASLA